MSLVVKILGRSRLEGGGHTTAGVAQNDKVFVWGELTGDYEAGGVDLTVQDLGLDGTFDFLQLNPVTFIAGTGVGLIEDDTSIRAQFSEPDGQLILQTVDNAGAVTESTTTAYVVNFFACGNNASSAELT